MKRSSFQRGCIIRKKRKTGPDIVAIRYRQGGKLCSKKLGTVIEIPNDSIAWRVVAEKYPNLNGVRETATVAALIERFLDEALPERQCSSGPYRSNLKRIRQSFGDVRVDDWCKDVAAIEKWINELNIIQRGKNAVEAKPVPLAKKTRSHIKALIHRLIECAMKWGFISSQRNPVQLVEVKGKRNKVRIRIIVPVPIFHRLIADHLLPRHVKVMIVIAMTLGLRASEILGLRWEDFDFIAHTVHIRRSVTGKEVNETKSWDSEEILPLHEDLERLVLEWRDTAPEVQRVGSTFYGWLFANPAKGRPYHRDSLQEDHLEPAGRRVGIIGLGWHSFRHTYRSMLKLAGVELEVQQNLMRHAHISTTVGYGWQGDDLPLTRPANAKIVELVMPSSRPSLAG